MKTKRNSKLTYLAILAGVLMVTSYGVRQINDLRSSAAPVRVTTRIDVPPPPPKTLLQSPYIRLVTQKETYGVSEKIPVDVYVHTDGEQILETGIIISFDPSLVSITHEDIEMTSVFATGQADVYDDRVDVYTFNTPQAGQDEVVLATERRVATLTFTPTHAGIAEFTLLQDPAIGAGSSITGQRAAPGESVVNLLKSVESVRVNITP